MNVYIGSACGLVGWVGHSEVIFLKCVCFGGTGSALILYSLSACVLVGLVGHFEGI